MSNRLRELAQRRTRLQLRCASQRDELEHLIAQIETPIHRIDNTILKVRDFARRPPVMFGALATVFLIGPRKLMRVAGKTWFWISTARSLVKSGSNIL